LWLRLRLDAPTLQTLERIVESELAHHLDRRLRSIDVLRAIEGRGAVRVPVD
jgi:wyosine [tRNA(Phe)-imidazoG37] synthetase (radical SAM superfamily)